VPHKAATSATEELINELLSITPTDYSEEYETLAEEREVQAIQLRLCTDLLELVRRSREEKDGGGGNSNRGDGKRLGKALSKCGFNK
jgi:hypothetical protein